MTSFGITVTKADFSLSDEIGTFMFDLESELWPGSRERIKREDYIDTSRRLLNSYSFRT